MPGSISPKLKSEWLCSYLDLATQGMKKGHHLPSRLGRLSRRIGKAGAMAVLGVRRKL